RSRAKRSFLVLVQRAEIVLYQVAQSNRDALRVVPVGWLPRVAGLHAFVRGLRGPGTGVGEIRLDAAFVRRDRPIARHLLRRGDRIELGCLDGVVLVLAAVRIAASLAGIAGIALVAALGAATHAIAAISLTVGLARTAVVALRGVGATLGAV